MHADLKRIQRLLKTARGQIGAINKMIDEDRYCIDISTQILACRSILQKINMEILHGHLTTCVDESMPNSSEAEKIEKVEEMMLIIKKISR